EVRVPASDAADLRSATLTVNGSVTPTQSGRQCIPELGLGAASIAGTCVIRFVVPPQVASGYDLTLATAGHRAPLPEVPVNSEPNVPPASAPCRTDLLALDGQPVGITLQGTLSELRRGVPIPAAVCGFRVLGAGWHRLAATPGVPINAVRLTALGGR